MGWSERVGMPVVGGVSPVHVEQDLEERSRLVRVRCGGQVVAGLVGMIISKVARTLLSLVARYDAS